MRCAYACDSNASSAALIIYVWRRRTVVRVTRVAERVQNRCYALRAVAAAYAARTRAASPRRSVWAIAIEPELMSLRWDAVLYLERRTEAVLEELWALIEEDYQQPDVVTVVACLSLFAGDIALAPARGALSELLLAGEGDEVTVQLHQVLRGDRVAFPSESSAWLEKPSCSALLNVSF